MELGVIIEKDQIKIYDETIIDKNLHNINI